MAISQGVVLDNNPLAWTTVGPSSGDLFILFFYNDGGDDQTTPGDLTRFDSNGGSTMEAGAYYRECTGLETGNVFTDQGDFGIGNEGYNAHWFLVPSAEWYGTTLPEMPTRASGGTGTVDPPSNTPSGWDASAEDTIWIICGGRDDDDGITSVSSGYSTNEQLSENINQVEVGSSYRIAATATEDPGIYTHTGTAEEWVAYTIAVRPSLVGQEFASLFDSVGITDTITNFVGRIVALVDMVGITDSISNIGTFVRALADPVGIIDTIATVRKIIKALVDSVGVTDVISTIKIIVKSIADSVGITDTIANSVGRIVALVDSVGITDAVATTRKIILLLTDPVGITDTLSRSAGRFVSFVESVGITDIFDYSKWGVKFAAIADTLGITDTLSRIGTFIRLIAESVGVTDLLSTIRSIVLSLLDPVGITDVVTRSAGRFRTISDDVGITDTIEVARGIVIFFLENLGITDSLSRIGTYLRTISENIGITDIFSRSIFYVRVILGTLGIIDILEGLTEVILVSKRLLLLYSLTRKNLEVSSQEMFPIFSTTSSIIEKLELISKITVYPRST